MKEDLLHYIWQFKRFDSHELYTVGDEKIEILQSGYPTHVGGPDFFDVRLSIGKQKWAGNVEIHSNASDWYAHHHEKDDAYDNVILHVVWNYDVDIYRKDNSEIPVLELKRYVSQEMLKKYHSLMRVKTWIFCEKDIAKTNKFVFRNWLERLFFERLEKKSFPIKGLLEDTKNDWEAVLFYNLAGGFGLNVNGDVFFKIAKSLPFEIIKKESSEIENLEALFFGRAGLLDEDKEDTYYTELKNRWLYLCMKYQLEPIYLDKVQFFKLRPDNFPTIRLAQLAQLYYRQKKMFYKLVHVRQLSEIYDIFDISLSKYWQTHYQFDKESPFRKKTLSKAFIDLLIINTIVPFQFVYSRHIGKENIENLIDLMNDIKSEQNTVIDRFVSCGIKVENAFESQALKELKNEYCIKSRCMQCEIGVHLIK